jgi:hypothetical protein
VCALAQGVGIEKHCVARIGIHTGCGADFASYDDRSNKNGMDLQQSFKGSAMKLIIDLGDRKIEESHPSEAEAREHLSTVLSSHKTRGHRVAREDDDLPEPRYVVLTPEGRLQYWLEQ